MIAVFKFLNLLFPQVCLNCNERLQSAGIICSSCEQKFSELEHICEVCGSPNQNYKCKVCGKIEFYFDKARSVFKLNNLLRNLIHNFKYEEFTKIGRYLGCKAVSYLQQEKPFAKIDYIIPVPLHKVKKRKRGFNQAKIISDVIAKNLKLQYKQDILQRQKFTKTQTKLSRQERKQNVRKAFSVKYPELIRNKNILVVDDVFTTGSTVNSIAETLKKCNVNRVFVLTIARA